MSKIIATAVFIKTESGDSYLFNFAGDLNESQAEKKAESLCPEYPEHWSEVEFAWATEEA